MDKSKSVAPGTPIEIVLARIWCEVLGLKHVGINDNFFELGGHSLLAVQLISKINKSLSLHLPIPVFFQNPTIRKLTTVFDRENHDKRETKLIQLKAGQSTGALFMLDVIDVSIGLCRLAEHLEDSGLSIFGTIFPLSDQAIQAATLDQTEKLPSLEESERLNRGAITVAFPFLTAGLLVGVVIIVGALTYFPALSLGPIVEHLML